MTTRERGKAFTGHQRTKTVLSLIFVLSLSAFLSWQFSATLKGSDFPDFYCAARMLADGLGHRLYDADLQRQYQAHYAERVGTLYIHPPPEAALYLAVAWLPLKQAYLLWFWLNVAGLAIAARWMSKNVLLSWEWSSLLAAWLTFVPVLLCLQQGQDSIILLLVVILAFTALRRGQGFAAGCCLGLALFKFQLVLPLILVLILACQGKTRGALARGFALTMIGFAAVSAAISGWDVFLNYPQFLMHLQAQPFAGISSNAMANFRGLISLILPRQHSAWLIPAVVMLSTLALVQTLVVCRRSQTRTGVELTGKFDAAFSISLLFTLLVSYHLNPHDLSLLLIPLAVLLQQTRAQKTSPARNWMALSLMAILFLPPLHVWTLMSGGYALIALPMWALFLAWCVAPRERSGQIRIPAR